MFLDYFYSSAIFLNFSYINFCSFCANFEACIENQKAAESKGFFAIIAKISQF